MEDPRTLRRLKEMEFIKKTGHSSEYWKGYIEGIKAFSRYSQATLKMNEKHLIKLNKIYQEIIDKNKINCGITKEDIISEIKEFPWYLFFMIILAINILIRIGGN